MLTYFYRINCISVHWSWNFSSGVIVNFLWDVYKPDICFCLPLRFLEVNGEGSGWVFRLVSFNWLIWFISNILQVLHSSLLFFIFDLFVSYLLDQHLLILELVLRCYHMYFLIPQVCGRLWKGWRFLWFYLSLLIHWFDSRQFLKFFGFEFL